LRTALSDRNGGSAEFFNSLHGQLKAARATGERFIFAVFWWRQDGISTGWGNFYQQRRIWFNDKNDRVFAVAPPCFDD
jgi:hypothetical protein